MKHLTYLILMLIFLLCITTVSATDDVSISDVNDSNTAISSDGSDAVGDSNNFNIDKEITKEKVTNKLSENRVTVNNYNELYNAVMSANSFENNTIVLSGDSVYTITRTINLQSMNTRKNITIDGCGRVINGNNAYSFLQIGSRFNIGLYNLTVANASSNYNSAIVNSGNLTINYTNFTNNHLTMNNNETSGGAISNQMNANLTIDNSVFRNNSASLGGAIINSYYSKMYIYNSEFYNNTARDGGAINTQYNASSWIYNSIFYDNEAYLGGALINLYSSSTTVNNTTFRYNTARDGGAINNQERSFLRVYDSLFEDNNATYGGAVINFYNATSIIESSNFNSNYAVTGGAIENVGRSNMTLTTNNFTGNYAELGGSVYNGNTSNISIDNNIFLDNYATEDGVIFNNGSISITNNLFVNNTDDVNDLLIKSLTNDTLVDNNTYIDNLLETSIVFNYTSLVINDTLNHTYPVVVELNPIYNDFVHNGTVTVYLNNVPYGTFNVVDSVANITLNNDIIGDEYNLTISYTSLSKHYQNSSKSLPLNWQKINTILTVTNINSISVGDKVNITGRLTDLYENPLNNKEIRISINNSNISVQTDSEGYYTYEYTGSSSGNISVNVLFNGDYHYNPSSISTNFEILKVESALIVNILNDSIGNTTINITLIDSENNVPLANQDVVITLSDGTTIETVTDDNGNVIEVIDLPAGTNEITISYSGNETYTPCSTNITITVNKKPTNTTAVIINNTIENVTIRVTVTDSETGQPVTGNVNITYNGELIGYGNLDNNGIATILTNISSVGDYTVNVNYEGTETYQTSSTTLDINVEKRNTTIIANCTNNTANNVTINITIVEPETNETITNGTLIITDENGTIITTVNITNNTTVIELNNTITEPTNITIIYNGTETYNKTNKTLEINPEKIKTQITIENINTTIIGTNIWITGVLTDEYDNPLSDRTVYITLNNKQLSFVTNANGEYSGSYVASTIGNYTVNVNYRGDEIYSSATTITTFEVIKRNSSLNVEIVNNTIGNTTLNITLTDPTDNTPIANQEIIITLPNGTTIETVTDNNGNIIETLDLPAGTNEIVINYSGNETYEATNTTITITVDKKPTSTSAIMLNNTVENVTIHVTVTDQETGQPVTGNVNITYNGELVGYGNLNNDGTATILTSITISGDYSLNVNYEGTETYQTSSTTLDINVIKRNTTIIANCTNNTINNTTINITIIDPVTNETITNGTIIITDENGTIITTVNITNNTTVIELNDTITEPTNITIIYNGTETYNKTNTTIEINPEKIKTQITIDSINTTVVGTNVCITGILTDEYDNPLSNMTGYITFNNEYITFVTNDYGVYNVSYNSSMTGTYHVNVNYDGNEFYSSATASTTFEVIKRNSTLNVEIINNTIGNTTINITLIDSTDNTPIANQDITIILPNGSIIETSTDNNGNVIETLDLPAGTNEIVISYSGNETYEATNTTVTITVNKKPTSTTAVLINNTIENVTIQVNVTDQETGQAVNGNVNITYNGELIGYSSLDSNGIATILTNITSIGDYTVNVNYEGTETYQTSSTTLNTNVIKRNTTIIANCTNNTANNVTINITIIDPETNETITNGTLIITDENGTVITTVNITNNTTVIELNDTITEPTNITIIYNGTETYNKTNTTIEINPEKIKTQLTLDNINTTVVGTNTLITGVLTDEYGNPLVNMSVYINTPTENITVITNSNGEYSAIYISDSVGVCEVNVTYFGDEIYSSSTNSTTFELIKRDSNLTVGILNTTIGNTSVNITLTDLTDNSPIANQDIIITLPNGTTIQTTTDNNGNIIETLDLPAETNEITISYLGNETYTTCSTNLTIVVNKKPSIATGSILNNTIGNVTIQVSVTDSETGQPVTGNVNITYNNELIGYGSLDSNGSAVILTNITSVGNYTISVNYEGNDYYLVSQDELNLDVIPKSSSVNVDVVNNSAGNTTLNISVVDSETNTSITNGTLIIVDSNNTVIGMVNITGNETIIYLNDSVVGLDNITVIYNGSSVYNKSNESVVLNLSKINTFVGLDVDDSVMILNSTVISAVLSDEYGNRLGGKVINLIINGVGVSISSDINGQISYVYNTSVVGVKNVSIEFMGDNVYMSSSNSSSFNVVKRPVLVRVEPINNYVEDTLLFKAYVTDLYGNNISEGQLVFKINGRTLRTDLLFNTNDTPALKFKVVNGVVEFTLYADLYLRGAVNVSATFSGSNIYCYNRSVAEVASVKLRTPSVVVSVNQSRVNQNRDIEFIAHVFDVTNGSNLTPSNNNSAFVIFKVNGVTIKNSSGEAIRVPVVDGVARYVYHVPSGFSSVDNDGVELNYSVMTVYYHPHYITGVRNTSVFNVERSITSIEIYNTSYSNRRLTINASIFDYEHNPVVGRSSVAVKVNGLTISNSSGDRIVYGVYNGNINFGININLDNVKINNITVVTGERQAYYASNTISYNVLTY